MTNDYKRRVRRQLRRLEYQGTGRWIYTRHVLGWTLDSLVTKQLPLGLRMFCLYCRLYIRLLPFPTIVFGHGLYLFSRWFSRRQIGRAPWPMQVQGIKFYLDLRDPGALSAIQELAGSSELRRALEALLERGSMFIDVGANQGIFSIVAANVLGCDGKIIAIEPQPALSDCIELSLAASKAGSWQVYRCAVSDEAGIGNMIIPRENNGEARLERNGGDCEVPVSRLDELLLDVDSSRPCIMKMDIEGGELGALRGARAFIKRFAPTLLVEINPEAAEGLGHSLQELRDELDSLGYCAWSRIDALLSRQPITTMPLDHYTDVVLWHD